VPEIDTQFEINSLSLPPEVGVCVRCTLLPLPALLPVLLGALCHKDMEYAVCLPIVLPFSLKSEEIRSGIQQQSLEGHSERGG